MKRGNATQTKLNSQKIDFVRGLHYEYVEEVARRKVEEEKRRKRIDIIVKMNIGKGKCFKLPNGAEVFV